MKKLIILNDSDTAADSNSVDLETLKDFEVPIAAAINCILNYTKPKLSELINLFPDADLLLCNITAVENLLQLNLNSYQDIPIAAQRLLELGAKSVLIKANQLNQDSFCQDYWSNQEESFWIATPRLAEHTIVKKNIFSTAIAACLVRSYSLQDAIVIAKMYLQCGLRKAIAAQTQKFFHGGWPEEQADLPYLSSQPLVKLPQIFKPCNTNLYPIVESSVWVERLLTLGIKCIQLRIKNANEHQLEKEIKRSVDLAKHYQAKLFINDYWQLAIHYHATGVHLGQEDLHDADIDAIYHSGLYLGVSTHCYSEVARAHSHHPSYIACGPIYFTQSKPMAFQPQGIEQLKRWRRTLTYPLVAIGGINLERLPEILESHVEGISVISAITLASDPATAIKEFLFQINQPNYV
ncbi:MAG: Thiamine-phosphate pyrophosphorylase [Pseudomonadota bacterium]|jgi:hydroxymethylpyrimidine kinase / phosphomethylpyrimidine kinase / thiamine-phosphate diphosphorylase